MSNEAESSSQYDRVFDGDIKRKLEMWFQAESAPVRQRSEMELILPPAYRSYEDGPSPWTDEERESHREFFSQADQLYLDEEEAPENDRLDYHQEFKFDKVDQGYRITSTIRDFLAMGGQRVGNAEFEVIYTGNGELSSFVCRDIDANNVFEWQASPGYPDTVNDATMLPKLKDKKRQDLKPTEVVQAMPVFKDEFGDVGATASLRWHGPRREGIDQYAVVTHLQPGVLPIVDDDKYDNAQVPFGGVRLPLRIDTAQFDTWTHDPSGMTTFFKPRPLALPEML